MQKNFEIITQAFEKAGIDIPTAEFSITGYSLNTELSFKFENLEEFLFFLNLHIAADDGRTKKITAMVIDSGIDPRNFFYVNFYRPKVAEL